MKQYQIECRRDKTETTLEIQAKFLRTPFLTEHFRWLLLYVSIYIKKNMTYRFSFHLFYHFYIELCYY